jgi:hypothetical protein
VTHPTSLPPVHDDAAIGVFTGAAAAASLASPLSYFCAFVCRQLGAQPSAQAELLGRVCTMFVRGGTDALDEVRAIGNGAR